MLSDISEFFLLFDAIDILVIVINITLMLSASKIMSAIYHDSNDEQKLTKRVQIFRAFNLAIIVAFSYYHLALPVSEKGVGFKILAIILILYLSYLFIHILTLYIHDRFGKSKTIDDRKVVIETYHSRIISIVANSLLVLVLMIAIIRILGFDSWLEAGGIIGVLGVILALTQNVWAPDLFSGLILLNSNIVESGDVIEIENRKDIDLAIIYKVRLFHTELLNLVNNHRLMIRNEKLRNLTINNLSKFASAKGLRERICFNVSYDDSINEVKDMFCTAFNNLIKNGNKSIEDAHGIEVSTTNAGDYAVEYTVFFYTKDIKKLLKTRYTLIEEILLESSRRGILLSTPTMINAAVNKDAVNSKGA